MKSTTRREALVLIASAPTLGAQQHHEAAADTPPSAPYQPRTLTPAEMEFSGLLCDLIIPRTDTPGASDAGVPEFIDRRLGASPDLAARFRQGLSLLGVDFIHLPQDRQVAILSDAGNAPESEAG